MRKIYVLFLLVLFVGCEKEEDLVHQNLQVVEVVDFEDLPSHIKSLIPLDYRKEANLRLAEKESGGHFTPISANKLTNEKGRVSYTFLLENSGLQGNDGTPYFDNLVIQELADGREKIRIIRYEPEAKWYSDQKKSFKNFTGTATFFDVQGKRLGRVEIKEGRAGGGISTQASDVVEECVYTLEYTLCVGGNYGPANCTYYFKEDCTLNGSGGGDGDSGGSGGTPPGGGDGWGGGDGNSGGGSPGGNGGDDSDIGTVPLPTLEPLDPPEGEEVKIENNIEDPCASLIFNQLVLLSMEHNLPPDVSYNSVYGLDTDIHFSEGILNLFNESAKFDYIVNSDPSLDPKSNAKTYYPAVYNPITGNYGITTSFNPDYLGKATDLSMARTMIHESVHAYLIYVLKGEPFDDMKEALDAYIDKNEFPNTFNNNLNHNFMAQFVNAIAYQLQLWDQNHGTGGNLGWQYYHDMAWGGLTGYQNPNDEAQILFYGEFDEYLNRQVSNIIDDKSRNEKKNFIKERILDLNEMEKINGKESSQEGLKNKCQ